MIIIGMAKSTRLEMLPINDDDVLMMMKRIKMIFWSDFPWRLTHRLGFTGSGFNKRSNWKRANNDFFYKCICFTLPNIFIW